MWQRTTKQKNAQALELKGAALLIPDHKAEEEGLFDTVLPLLEQPEKLATLGTNAKRMLSPAEKGMK